jgi:hypothetical protein
MILDEENAMRTALHSILLILLLFVYPASAEQRVAIPLENSPTLGPENAPVTIFEFIDFQ